MAMFSGALNFKGKREYRGDCTPKQPFVPLFKCMCPQQTVAVCFGRFVVRKASQFNNTVVSLRTRVTKTRTSSTNIWTLL